MIDKDKVKLEYYVLNWDHNANKVVNFNIFRNWPLRDAAIKHAEQLINGEIDYAEFKEELRKDIMWQEWSRFEYEISVGRPFEENCDNLEKWDCYAQAAPNLDLIAGMVVREVRRAIYESKI